jgi:hypothetical protein
MEGKMQKAMKYQAGAEGINDMKEHLKHLHEKRKEILKRESINNKQ